MFSNIFLQFRDVFMIFLWIYDWENNEKADFVKCEKSLNVLQCFWCGCERKILQSSLYQILSSCSQTSLFQILSFYSQTSLFLCSQCSCLLCLLQCERSSHWRAKLHIHQIHSCGLLHASHARGNFVCICCLFKQVTTSHPFQTKPIFGFFLKTFITFCLTFSGNVSAIIWERKKLESCSKYHKQSFKAFKNHADNSNYLSKSYSLTHFSVTATKYSRGKISFKINLWIKRIRLTTKTLINFFTKGNNGFRNVRLARWEREILLTSSSCQFEEWRSKRQLVPNWRIFIDTIFRGTLRIYVCPHGHGWKNLLCSSESTEGSPNPDLLLFRWQNGCPRGQARCLRTTSSSELLTFPPGLRLPSLHWLLP